MKNVIKNALRIVEIGCLATLAVKAAVDLVAMAKEQRLFVCEGCDGRDGCDDGGCHFCCEPSGDEPDPGRVCGEDGPCDADFEA